MARIQTQKDASRKYACPTFALAVTQTVRMPGNPGQTTVPHEARANRGLSPFVEAPHRPLRYFLRKPFLALEIY